MRPVYLFLKALTALALFFQTFTTFSANHAFVKENYNISVSKISADIKIDGYLNERQWQGAGTISAYMLHYPIDTGRTDVQTQIKMMYDEYNIYIGLITSGFNELPVVQSLKRDDQSNSDYTDGITIVLDPANTAKNGYFFKVNSAGALIDGTVYQNGMYPSGNIYWNNKWFAKTRQNKDTVFYEIVIPFASIKYKKENNKWGINFLRVDMARKKTYAWTPFSAGKHDLDLGFTGNLIFKDGLQGSKSKKFFLMPSVTTGIVHKDNTSFIKKAGLDARVSVNSSLNLDLSAYPDFSNVEVDQQYIDFYRFEYYQPEQRNFFLENNDLFSSFGTYDDFNTSPAEPRVKPIYTRRLGKIDGADIPILYGARLSGEVVRNTRIGILSLQTEKSGKHEAQNYFVGSFQEGLFKRSSIKGLFTNRSIVSDSTDFNRTGGLEFDFSTEDGKWTANAKIHSSFTDEKYKNNMFYGGGFAYYNKIFKAQNWVEHVDKNYITDMGFVPRLYYKDPLTDTVLRYGYTHFSNKYELYQFLANNFVMVMGEYTNIHTYLDENNRLNEFGADLGYWSVFANRAHIVLQGAFNRYELLIPHDVLGNNNPVPKGTYKNFSMFFLYESNRANKFRYNTSFEYGGFYKGTKRTISGGPLYAFQPYGTISLMYNNTNIDLNELGNATYHLVGLKPEISFTTNILWTSLIQYNTQLKNLNFNSIFQWRYRPMSDFYIIIKDDYYTSWKHKRFELSFKLNYWFGV